MSFRFGKRRYIGDAVIVASLLALCFLPLLFTSGGGKVTQAKVILGGETVALLPLSDDCEMSPDGGHTVVCVSGGRAYIKFSDCPDGVCTEMNGVDSDGGSAVCVPNRVSVLPCGGENRLDAVAG